MARSRVLEPSPIGLIGGVLAIISCFLAWDGFDDSFDVPLQFLWDKDATGGVKLGIPLVSVAGVVALFSVSATEPVVFLRRLGGVALLAATASGRAPAFHNRSHPGDGPLPIWRVLVRSCKLRLPMALVGSLLDLERDDVQERGPRPAHARSAFLRVDRRGDWRQVPWARVRRRHFSCLALQPAGYLACAAISLHAVSRAALMGPGGIRGRHGGPGARAAGAPGPPLFPAVSVNLSAPCGAAGGSPAERKVPANLRKPTPGLEPGTPSLRVRCGGSTPDSRRAQSPCTFGTFALGLVPSPALRNRANGRPVFAGPSGRILSRPGFRPSSGGRRPR
jgi:hypothetical protein